MTQSLFALILAVILTICGPAMIWLTRPAVWARLDAQALEHNPLRRMSRRGFPRADAAASRWARVVLRGMGWGCLLLGGAAFAALALRPA